MLRNHLRSVRHILTHSRVFVFTFGLTEAWIDRRDGSVFPVCPGTAAGVFDPDLHAFHNFTVGEVLSDMRAFVARVRSVNPGIRFLFTVSPVPLVATAEAAHVLVATAHSKAVLRAAAGELAAEDPDIAYFPSYEIITGAPARSMFFAGDMRSVLPAGVDQVMAEFFAAHRAHERIRGPGFRYEEMRHPVCDEVFLNPDG